MLLFNVFCSVLQCQRIQNFATRNSLPEIISNSDSAHCQQPIMSFYRYHVIWQWARAHHLLKNLIFGTPTCFINWYLKTATKRKEYFFWRRNPNYLHEPGAMRCRNEEPNDGPMITNQQWFKIQKFKPMNVWSCCDWATQKKQKR